MPSTPSTVISRSEVEKHNTEKNCYVVIHNRIFNLTSFLDEHPGGRDIILDQAGGDATAEFDAAGHSPNALQMMEKYVVGSVPPEEAGRVTKAARTAAPSTPYGAIVFMAVLMAIVAAALFYS